jgi:hypothetical protein
MNSDDKRELETTRFLENLTEFSANDNRPMEELTEDLRADGMNPERLLTGFRKLLTRYAPTWREQATRERLLIREAVDKAQAITHRSRSETETQIQASIESMRRLGAQVEAGAYYRKFQEARDEDLESLLVDLTIQLDFLSRNR